MAKLAPTKMIPSAIPPQAKPHCRSSRGISVGITRRVKMRITSGATNHGTIAHAFPRDSAKPQLALRMNSPM
jgi:hypothetical protein